MLTNHLSEALKGNLESYNKSLSEIDKEVNPKEARDLETKIKLAKYELQNYLVTFRDLCSSRLFQIRNITSIFTTIHKVFY